MGRKPYAIASPFSFWQQTDCLGSFYLELDLLRIMQMLRAKSEGI